MQVAGRVLAARACVGLEGVHEEQTARLVSRRYGHDM
jgi:hypothetical protein